MKKKERIENRGGKGIGRKERQKRKHQGHNSQKENQKENSKGKEEDNRQGRELARQRETRKLENDEQEAKKKIPGNLKY